jgi:hypothetical protein
MTELINSIASQIRPQQPTQQPQQLVSPVKVPIAQPTNKQPIPVTTTPTPQKTKPAPVTVTPTPAQNQPEKPFEPARGFDIEHIIDEVKKKKEKHQKTRYKYDKT